MDNQEPEEKEIQDEGEVLSEPEEFVSTSCTFKQRGPYLVCISCQIQHAVWIGMDKIMTGEDDDGKPILKSRGLFFK